MAVDPGNVVRATVKLDLAGVTMINVFEFQNVGSASPDNESVFDALATYFDESYAWLNDVLQTNVSGVDLKIDKVIVEDGKKTVLENVGQGPWADTFEPAGVGERLPSTIAALTKFLTSHGKSFGRKFLGGFLEADSNGDTMGEDVLEALMYFATWMLTHYPTGEGWSLVPGVLSLGKDTAGSFFEFLLAEIGTYWNSQRRRRPGVGV
jgi:hypothetical protein